jgi:hypothetical protein
MAGVPLRQRSLYPADEMGRALEFRTVFVKASPFCVSGMGFRYQIFADMAKLKL